MPRKPKPGTCRGCGCTDEMGCPEGCYWADGAHTLCSECAEAIECPTCLAKPGFPCFVASGRTQATVAPRPHPRRCAEAA